MGLIDRLADIVGGTGRAISRVADAMRTPAPGSDVAVKPSSNPAVTAPTVEGIPGTRPWGSYMPTSQELTDALQTAEAYFGKLSQDAGPSPTRYSSYPAADLT